MTKWVILIVSTIMSPRWGSKQLLPVIATIMSPLTRLFISQTISPSNKFDSPNHPFQTTCNLHYSIIPSFHHSNIPIFQYSTIPNSTTILSQNTGKANTSLPFRCVYFIYFPELLIFLVFRHFDLAEFVLFVAGLV